MAERIECHRITVSSVFTRTAVTAGNVSKSELQNNHRTEENG